MERVKPTHIRTSIHTQEQAPNITDFDKARYAKHGMDVK
jgi:hypothetical protein